MGLDLDTDLVPIPDQVETAQLGTSLRILGETKNNLHLTLGNFPTKFKFKPVVVDGLSMHINISGPFLKRHNIDQLHSLNCLRLNGQDIPLYGDFNNPTELERIESDITIPQSLLVPPMSVHHFNARIDSISSLAMPAGTGAIVGSLDFMSQTNCHPWLNAMVTPEVDGHVRLGVMNTTSDAIRIPAGTKYGSFKLACSMDEQARYPWRVAAILAPIEPTHPSRTDKFHQSFHQTQPNSLATIPSPKEKIDELPPFMIGPTTNDNKSQRIKFIQEIFRLKESSFLKTKELVDQATTLLLRYWHTFSFDGSFGATDLLQHTIFTEPGPPINQRYRPINPNLEPHLKHQIDEWLKHDVIEKSNSPYNFGLVCVPKKNGKFRWCIDYRDLNKISKRDTFPIGNIEDNLARLSNSKIFSGLDGSGAFHVIPLEKHSKEKTAFATPFGLYQFKRLPFGLANGPATYARLIKMVLNDIPTNVAIPYLDDTIIHSPDLSTHFRDIASVLEAHEKAGLKLQPSKCQLFQDSIDYLGHRVSKDGIAPLKDHTEIIRTWPMPTTRNEVRIFLGKVGYYRRFIKNFAGIAKPMTDKLAKDGNNDKHVFPTSKDYQESFTNLKTALLTAPILAYPRFQSNEPFILDTDWSYDNAAIGAVLLQKQDGLERVIAYGGHKLITSQRNYGPTKGELYAVVYFVNYYKYYLAHRKFIAVSYTHLTLPTIYSV